MDRLRRWSVPGLPFAVSLILSLWTVGSHVYWQDSGFYLNAVHDLGVLYPHGPDSDEAEHGARRRPVRPGLGGASVGRAGRHRALLVLPSCGENPRLEARGGRTRPGLRRRPGPGRAAARAVPPPRRTVDGRA